MTPNELREAYLAFFEAKGHTRHPSDSLIPSNDPTILFTGAGMNQFKEMFLGIGNLPFSRATTSQKCFRAGDLDEVGRTDYHHTFFEMLGNFSFGDYFKKEAITWAWEFITEHLKLDPARIWVSVYEEDDEAYRIWTEDVGFPAERMWKLGPADNFWPADAPKKGPNGPCGPCSEIFWDYGSPGEAGDPEAKRYCEFWNLVFTQFNRVGPEDLEPLGQTNIDTGMGFERTLAVLSGVRSNFETELFRPILAGLAAVTGMPYDPRSSTGPLFRRIADHVRAATFLIADGVQPSNEGRGYVLRRVLRRAIRDGINLGVERPFLSELAAIVVGLMGEAYPEVAASRETAAAFLLAEEEKFRATYETGMDLLEDAMEGLRSAGATELSGATAFALYDSHGFPIDLSEQILAEHGFTVDRGAFDRAMEEQRQRSREHSTMKGEVFRAGAVSDMKRTVPPTLFVGYDREEHTTEILALIRDDALQPTSAEGEEVRLVVRETPCYAESGGQVGDAGVAACSTGRVRIRDTQKVEGYILHAGIVETGSVSVGDAVTLTVDSDRRCEIRRNHTATHLLHSALRTVLGDHVRQAGSLVAPDRLRFDFTHPTGVADDELRAIEDWVNDRILADTEVVTREEDLEAAQAAGAMALFGEKYDNRVRVVTIGDESMELCGGTHVGRVGEIGPFLITQETSVGSGSRRVEAVTGSGALHRVRQDRERLNAAAAALKTTPDRLPERIEALREEIRDWKRRAQEHARAEDASSAKRLVEAAPRKSGIAVVVARVPGDDAGALRELSDEIRKEAGPAVLLLAGRGEGGWTLISAATPEAVDAGLHAGRILQAFASEVGGKGGGRPQMAQGRAPAGADLEGPLEAAGTRLLEQLD